MTRSFSVTRAGCITISIYERSRIAGHACRSSPFFLCRADPRVEKLACIHESRWYRGTRARRSTKCVSDADRGNSADVGSHLREARRPDKGLRRPAEGLRHRAEGLRHRAEGLRRRAEDLRHRAEGLRRRAEGLRQRAEGLRHRAEGLRHRAEGLRRPAEGLRLSVRGLRLLVRGLRHPAKHLHRPVGVVAGGGTSGTTESTRRARRNRHRGVTLRGPVPFASQV
jgi:hypothetical protein